jgi:hypothetical protein
MTNLRNDLFRKDDDHRMGAICVGFLLFSFFLDFDDDDEMGFASI